MSNIKTVIAKHRNNFDLTDIKLLLCFILKKESSFLISNDDYDLSAIQLSKLRKLLDKRQKGYSVAVLTGKKEFYGKDFFVDENVLIPRPETELIIDEILGLNFKLGSNGKIFLDSGSSPEGQTSSQQGQTSGPEGQTSDLEGQASLKIFDIGTGTGCIPITLFNNIDKILDIHPSQTSFHPSQICFHPFNFYGSDISDLALKVARRNALLHGAKIKFIQSDLFSNIKEKSFDIITANLPYVPLKDKNESIAKEPDIALYSGNDGLDHYRRLADEMKARGINFKILLMEIAPFQSSPMKQIFKGFGKVKIIKDLAGNDRIVKIIKS